MIPLPDLQKLRPWLLRRAQKLCYGRSDAEDLVQDVLAKYVTTFQAHQPPNEQGAMAWLATALKIAFISRLRKERVYLRVEPDPALRDAVSPVSPDPEESPLSQIVTDEELELAMKSLTLVQRQVFEANARGLRLAEIAEELGIREGAVAKRLFDARKRVRASLLSLKGSSAKRKVAIANEPHSVALTRNEESPRPERPNLVLLVDPGVHARQTGPVLVETREPLEPLEPLEPPFVLRRRAAERPAPEPLLDRRTARALLVHACSVEEPLGAVDCDNVARALSRLEIVRHLPRRTIATSRRSVQVLIDVSESMLPFMADCSQLSQSLRRVVRVNEVLEFDGTPLGDVSACGSGIWCRWRPPPAKTAVVVISNLGSIMPPFRPGRASWADWIRFAELARRSRVPVVAFVPHELSRLPQRLARLMALVQWDRSTTSSAAVRAIRGVVRDR